MSCLSAGGTQVIRGLLFKKWSVDFQIRPYRPPLAKGEECKDIRARWINDDKRILSGSKKMS